MAGVVVMIATGENPETIAEGMVQHFENVEGAECPKTYQFATLTGMEETEKEKAVLAKNTLDRFMRILKIVFNLN